MRFLADESCSFAIVRGLEAEGHDAQAVSSLIPGASDEEVIAEALRSKRVLLTEDSDFGRLVYASGAGSVGVIYFRYPRSASAQVIEETVQLVAKQGERLTELFAVVQPGRIRLRTLF